MSRQLSSLFRKTAPSLRRAYATPIVQDMMTGEYTSLPDIDVSLARTLPP